MRHHIFWSALVLPALLGASAGAGPRGADGLLGPSLWHLAQFQPGQPAPNRDSPNPREPGKSPEVLTLRPPLVPPLPYPEAKWTDQIVRAIDLTNASCNALAQRLGRVYIIGCLAKGYRDLADRIPRRGAYEEVWEALDQVAKELQRIERSRADRARPRQSLRIRADGQMPERQLRNIRAVEEAAFGVAADDAVEAIERGKLVLLRSSAPEDIRRNHYQDIVDAFDQSAILLRSTT